jgi:hypothetical protein
MYLKFSTTAWLDLLTQLQKTCLNTSFSLMAASLQFILNTTLKTCEKHGILSSPWKHYSSRFRTVFIMQRQGGITISEMQKLHTDYAPKNHWNFHSACCHWSERNPPDRTWNNFKIHFATAYRQHKKMQVETSAVSGYANAAVSQAFGGIFQELT